MTLCHLANVPCSYSIYTVLGLGYIFPRETLKPDSLQPLEDYVRKKLIRKRFKQTFCMCINTLACVCQGGGVVICLHACACDSQKTSLFNSLGISQLFVGVQSLSLTQRLLSGQTVQPASLGSTCPCFPSTWVPGTLKFMGSGDWDRTQDLRL